MQNLSTVSKFCLIMISLLIAGISPLKADDIKDTVDQSLRQLRSTQNPDGSYGQPGETGIVTPLVVLAFGQSPRRYTDMDGPFIRKAAEWMAARQNEDGSFCPDKGVSNLTTTCFSIAALTSVNRPRWEKAIDQGCAYLNTCLMQKETFDSMLGSGSLFPAAMVVALSHSPRFKTLSGESSPYPALKAVSKVPASLHAAIWHLSVGQDLKAKTDFEAIFQMFEKGSAADGGSSTLESAKHTADTPSDLDLWAGAYLLSLCHEKGTAPEDWANRVSERLTQQLTAGPGNEKDAPTSTKELAILTNALSLCYGKVSAPTMNLGGAEDSELSPFVTSARPLKAAQAKALAFMQEHQVKGKFGFMGYPDPGISSLALSGVIRTSRALGEKPPAYVETGLDYLVALQKEDGSIYQTGLANYVTSAAIMALSDTEDARFQDVIKAARDFIVVLQADEGEGYSLEEDAFFGGMGYGGDERPDLSNTQMSVEALRAAGLDADHEAFKKAVQFLQKCQNLSEVNPTRIMLDPTKQVVSGNDGGGIYHPGASKADIDKIDEGIYVARSYGSMTYALLKSYLLAGLDPDDKRVQAAVKWIKSNYTLDENPGFRSGKDNELGQQGLYYYFLTMARALDTLGEEKIETPDHVVHLWRQELREAILALQREDGSWINHRSPRWFEGNPVLATAYALLVLDICREK